MGVSGHTFSLYITPLEAPSKAIFFVFLDLLLSSATGLVVDTQQNALKVAILMETQVASILLNP